MRNSPAVLLVTACLGLAGCVPRARILSAEPQALADKQLRIVVVDPYDASGTQEAAVLQIHVTRLLQELGYRHAETLAVRTATSAWKDEAAAAAARNRNAEAAFVVEILPDMESSHSAEPKLRAVARILDARTARTLYRAEFTASPEESIETLLAAALVSPLEDY